MKTSTSIRALTSIKTYPRPRSQLGMTLLEIMIVLAIIAVVMGFLVGPMVMTAWNEAKVKTTKLQVKKIADEAYSRWTVTTGKACPASLSDLDKYRNDKSVDDAWGNQLIALCGDEVPQGVGSPFVVFSKGVDGKRDTDDDITSWSTIE